MMRKLTVVIPTHDRPSKLRRSIVSCRKSSSKLLNIHVVVRNNSSQACFELTRQCAISFESNSYFSIDHYDVSKAGKEVIEADLNIFLSYFEVCECDWMLVLGDDDAVHSLSELLPDKVCNDTVIFSPASNLSSLDLDAYIYDNTLNTSTLQPLVPTKVNEISLDKYIGLSSFIYPVAHLKSVLSRLDYGLYRSIAPHWVCAFIAHEVCSQAKHIVRHNYLFWDSTTDKTNSEVRRHWLTTYSECFAFNKYLFEEKKITLRNFIGNTFYLICKTPNIFPVFSFFSRDVFYYCGSLLPLFFGINLVRKVVVKSVGVCRRLRIKTDRLLVFVLETFYSSLDLGTFGYVYPDSFRNSKYNERGVMFGVNYWSTIESEFTGLKLSSFLRVKPIVGHLNGGLSDIFQPTPWKSIIIGSERGSYYLLHAQDSLLGQPYIINTSKLLVSYTSLLHCLYVYLIDILAPIDLSSVEFSVTEFGGGYGNLCRIILSSIPSVVTYRIIDLPGLQCLQQTFLKLVNPCGYSKISFQETYKDIETPLCGFNIFIATFSLSETTAEVQAEVLTHVFNNYEMALISFQDVFEENSKTNSLLPSLDNRSVFSWGNLADIAYREGKILRPLSDSRLWSNARLIVFLIE